jgi:hypothetical protein
MGATKIKYRVDLSVVRSESITRNTTLAKLLSWIKYVEREGSGIQRALTDCVTNDAPLPTIENRDGFVVVKIFPSQRFGRVTRGEFGEDAATKAEVIKAVEEEQLARINSNSSAPGKLTALREYVRRDARSAYRVLRQLSDLPLSLVLSFLREETGWDGDDLTAYVSTWIYQGNGDAEILRSLIDFAGAVRDARTLAYVYYAILGNRLPIESAYFFRTCWRPMPSESILETVEISDERGPISFVMGSDDCDAPDNERPAHTVELSAFRIGRTPVTCKEYGAFTGVTIDKTEPVGGVAWWDAWIFCEWLGGSLPTEAQWECACRAGTTTTWWTGDDERLLLQAAWVDESEDGEAHPVGQKAPNHWGLFDVHGNVSEWCLDRYGAYVAGKQVNPRGPKSGYTRVLRGGNAAARADRSRSASRDHAVPHSASVLTGFRVAFDGVGSLV